MISKYKIYLTVFISGFVLMVFEIVGARILAPYLGSSSVVWTSIIGVILGFMSLGYWFGGKLADKHPKLNRLALILVFAAISILAINLGKDFILYTVTKFSISLIAKSLLSSVILFSIPSFLMAFITPFAIRLSMDGVKSSGETAGTIYAVSTIGSILGTFFSGFIFIAFFGTNQILWMLSIVLFLLAANLAFPVVKKHLFLGLILLFGNIYFSVKSQNYIDFDTDYSRIFITENKYNERDARFIAIDGYINSGMYLDKPNELIYKYTEFYDLVGFFSVHWKNAVMFGGAGYSYPKHFQNKYPNKQLDIVEIDPSLTAIAKEYFHFEPNPSTRIFHQDARYFLSNTTNKYDAVMYDVLTSNLTVPFHLTTQETFKSISNIMTTDGVLIMNLVGNLNGKGAKFIQSEIKTIQQVFSKIFIFNALGKDYKGITNYIIVALKTNKPITFPNSGYYYENFLNTLINPGVLNDGFVFTDDYAPANYLISK